MTNRPDGVLYVGITSDILRRAHQHRTGAIEGFTKRCKLHRLVWIEEHETAEDAIIREKRIKKWNRDWTKRLIHERNPEWHDLFNFVATNWF